MKDWEKWLNEQRNKNTMTVRGISLASVAPPWGMQTDGNFRREPPGFFNIMGAEIQANREVPAWSQPILQEIGKGIVVLVQDEVAEKLLLTIRQEPGNPANKGYILLGPTIQASESNLQQKHGGKRPPFAELLDKYEINYIDFSQDGGRFLEKINKYAILRVKSQKEVNLPPNARWFDLNELSEAVITGEANEHLLQTVALLTCTGVHTYTL